MDDKYLLAETFSSIALSEYKLNNFDLDLDTVRCEICFNTEECILTDISNTNFMGTSLSEMLDYFPFIKEYRIIERSFVLCYICVRQLVSSYLFLEKISKSEVIFKELVKLNKAGEPHQSVAENSCLTRSIDGIKDKDLSKKYDPSYDTFAGEENLRNLDSDKPVDMLPSRLPLKDVGITHDHSYIQSSDKNNFIEPSEEKIVEDEPERNLIIIEDNSNTANGQEEFICDLCKTVFARKQSLDYHIRRVHLNEKTFLCSTCGKQFFLKLDYNRHILLHRGETLHKCTICSKGFVASKLLKNHKMTVHKAKEMKCMLCPKMFKLKTQLRRHMAVHSSLLVEKRRDVTLKEKVECNTCGKKLNKYAMKAHMERHSDSKKYQCDICDQGFYQLLSLNRHIIRHQDPKYSCEYCGKSHFTKQEMLTHIRRQHTREIVCSCQHCGKGFVHQTNLIQHIRNCHPGDNEEKFVEPKIPMQCTVCGKIYSSRTSLYHHRRRAHENKEYSCPECKMTFRNLAPFKSHLKKIHDIGDTYNCDTCSRSFYTRGDLCKHNKRTHLTGVNSLYLCCTVCKIEKFKTKHELIQHMHGEHLINASTGPPILYECNFCVTFFVNFEIFQKHLNKEHPTKIGNELDILEYEIGGCKVQYFQNKRNVDHR